MKTNNQEPNIGENMTHELKMTDREWKITITALMQTRTNIKKYNFKSAIEFLVRRGMNYDRALDNVSALYNYYCVPGGKK